MMVAKSFAWRQMRVEALSSVMFEKWRYSRAWINALVVRASGRSGSRAASACSKLDVRKPPAADVRTDPSPAIPHHHQNRAEKHRDDNERQHASRDAVAKINDGGAITLVFTIGALCLLGTIMLCL